MRLEKSSKRTRGGECGVRMMEGPDNACIKNVVMKSVTLDNEYMLIKINKHSRNV